jgi:hypothetical protein
MDLRARLDGFVQRIETHAARDRHSHDLPALARCAGHPAIGIALRVLGVQPGGAILSISTSHGATLTPHAVPCLNAR